MSRTDLDAKTLANMLKRMAGDGSIEWVCEPMQASVLLDVADALDENAKLRELARGLCMAYIGALNECEGMDEILIWEHCEMVDAELAKSHARFEADRHRFDVAMRELGVEVDG